MIDKLLVGWLIQDITPSMTGHEIRIRLHLDNDVIVVNVQSLLTTLTQPSMYFGVKSKKTTRSRYLQKLISIFISVSTYVKVLTMRYLILGRGFRFHFPSSDILILVIEERQKALAQ